MPVSPMFGAVLSEFKYMKEITGKKLKLVANNANTNSSYNVC